MPLAALLLLLDPGARRRARERAERLVALRMRDGEQCARCRRPIAFDLPDGHDQAPMVIAVEAPGEGIESLRLCHARCSAGGIDRTEEVLGRVRDRQSGSRAKPAIPGAESSPPRPRRRRAA